MQYLVRELTYVPPLSVSQCDDSAALRIHASPTIIFKAPAGTRDTFFIISNFTYQTYCNKQNMRNLYLYLINESNIEILFDSGNGLEISFNLLFLFDVEFSGKNVPYHRIYPEDKKFNVSYENKLR